MFKILQKTFRTGIVTTSYPKAAAKISGQFRGRPEFDFEHWREARTAAQVCPTGAITAPEDGDPRGVSVDYGRCIFCGECAGPAVHMTEEFEMAVTDRRDLVVSHPQPESELAPQEVRSTIHSVLGRSLAIRQVDAGSCNGCELEIVALNNPIYDIERFGIHFVASPRHADMLLVTGPVTRNMELALRKTYDATPDPKLVVAVGACGISGGIFGTNYATVGGVDRVIPVNVYIPGCPPRPQALLHGILLAVGRLGREVR
jgi:Ni,Fe-hydrogenase III small subunit/ferredoxin